MARGVLAVQRGFRSRGASLRLTALCLSFLVAEAVASLHSQKSGTTSPDPIESQPLTVTASKSSSARKTPESFLGPNAALVNLDSLVTRPAPPAQSLNPFLAPGKRQLLPRRG